MNSNVDQEKWKKINPALFLILNKSNAELVAH